jgi:molybdate transport repressor ModE-like protein
LGETLSETFQLQRVAHLQTLVAVSRCGSLSAAARELGLTQQAVSARMAMLEKSVGQPLLHRSPAGVTLTAVGLTLSALAADVLDALERLSTTVASLSHGENSVLRTAASLTVAEYLLPRWLVRLRAIDPDGGASVAVSAANSATVFDHILRGTHELGFVETPLIPRGLHQRKVARDELVVVTSSGHPWARRGPGFVLGLQELAGTPLISREAGSGTRLSYERLVTSRLPDAHIAPPAMELPTTAAVKTAVLSGSAPAVLSILSVREDIEMGRLRTVRLSSHRLVRDITAVWPSRLRTLPSTARMLLDVIASPPHLG